MKKRLILAIVGTVAVLVFQNCGKNFSSQTFTAASKLPEPFYSPTPSPTATPTPEPGAPAPVITVPTQITGATAPSAAMARASIYDYAPSVMYDDNGKYRAWWCAGVSGDYIGYSEGDTLNTFPNNLGTYYWPNRSGGQIGTETSKIYFDGIHACDPSVIKHRETYYLYYGGGTYPTEACMDGATYNADGSVKTLDSGRSLSACSLILDLTKYPQINSVYSTQIGAAKSSDGVHWERMNSGLPIVSTFANPADAKNFATTYGSAAFPDNSTSPRMKTKMNVYGAGQPSVIVKDNIFYMLYTDTTGVGRRFYDDGTSGGAGLYMIRSPDPAFQLNVEEVRCPGDEQKSFHPGTCAEPYWKNLSGNKPSTRYAVIESYSADLTFSDALGLFAIVFRNDPVVMNMFFYDENFKLLQPGVILGGGQWRDGPAFLRRPDGHLLPSSLSDNVCSQIPLEIYSAWGTDPLTQLNPMTWDLWRWSATLQNPNPCTASQIAKLYEGALLASANRPLAYVTNGKKLYFEVGATALTLSRRMYNISNEVFDQIPLGAEIYTGKNADGSVKMKAVGATNLPAAFIDQNRGNQRWQLQCSETLNANNSVVEMITAAEWHANPFGGELFCGGVNRFTP